MTPDQYNKEKQTKKRKRNIQETAIRYKGDEDMKKRWNIIGRMTVCTLAAAMMVMIGSQFKMTARAEMVLDGEEAIQAVSEEETQAAYEEEL